MRGLKYLLLLIGLTLVLPSFAAQTSTVGWQNLLQYKDLNDCPAGMPAGTKCGTDPKPPCPKGEGCAPTSTPRNCPAPATGSSCGPSQTCCVTPHAASPFVCYTSTLVVSDCCIVGGGYCTGGRVCSYALDASGNPQFLLGCVLPSQLHKK